MYMPENVLALKSDRVYRSIITSCVPVCGLRLAHSVIVLYLQDSFLLSIIIYDIHNPSTFCRSVSRT